MPFTKAGHELAAKASGPEPEVPAHARLLWEVLHWEARMRRSVGDDYLNGDDGRTAGKNGWDDFHAICKRIRAELART